MPAKKIQSQGWPVKAVDAPKLSTNEWVLTAVPGVILLVMAILQLISFNDFKVGLALMGVASPNFWGACIIMAEIWGAAGFFKLRLSRGFRSVSYVLAVLVSGFWFINNLQLVASNTGAQMHNSYFFGRFLAQAPSWWTVLEVSILLFWVAYKVALLRERQE